MKREEVNQLLASVQHELAGRVSELRLRVVEGGLVLQGRANSYYAKQLAQQAVMKANGLPLVANDIEVLLDCQGTERGRAQPSDLSWGNARHVGQ
jgi:hypothetical protein